MKYERLVRVRVRMPLGDAGGIRGTPAQVLAALDDLATAVRDLANSLHVGNQEPTVRIIPEPAGPLWEVSVGMQVDE